MFTTSRFLVMVVAFALPVLVLSEAKADCKVYEASGCPNISALKCNEMSGIPYCVTLGNNVECVVRETQEVAGAKRTDIRDPWACQEGWTGFQTTGSNFCYQERDCSILCDWVPATSGGYYRCAVAGGQWTNAGYEWLIQVGAGSRCPNCQ